MEAVGIGLGPMAGAYSGLWCRHCQGLTSIKKFLILGKCGVAVFCIVPVVLALTLIKLSVII